jgi:hypothetical protein
VGGIAAALRGGVVTGRLTPERLAEIRRYVDADLPVGDIYTAEVCAGMRAELLAEVDALKADLRLADEAIRLFEESQIPMIPRAAQRYLDALDEEFRAGLAREHALREAVADLFGDLYLHHLGDITDAQLWASGDRAETAVRSLAAPPDETKEPANDRLITHESGIALIEEANRWRAAYERERDSLAIAEVRETRLRDAARRYLKTGSLTAEMDLRDDALPPGETKEPA